jgi:hypothetical protein
MGRAVWTYLLGPILAFLPRPWRARWWPHTSIEWNTATLISGVLEAVLSLAALGEWYFSYFTSLAEKFTQHTLGPHPDFHFEWGAVREAGLFAFALHPLTWTIAYCGCEGIVRAVAALAAKHSYGTLPLAAVDFFYRKVMQRAQPATLPLVADEITPGTQDFDFRISSCRQKPLWKKHPFTIRYAGAYFQVVGESFIAAGPRPYMYFLRRLRPGEDTGGVQDYRPEDTLFPAR